MVEESQVSISIILHLLIYFDIVMLLYMCYHIWNIPYIGKNRPFVCIDDKDRLLLNALLMRFYCKDMLQVGYTITESGQYVTPPPGDLRSYLSHIEKFPLIPMPEAFGLDANADITKDLNETSLILKSMLQASMATAGGGSSDQKASETIAELIRSLIKTLPLNFDIEACERKYPILYEESMHSVLSQEMARFNKLLERYVWIGWSSCISGCFFQICFKECCF